jgi:polysaccharide export outer membrane protein
MGRSVSLFLVRAAGIACAVLLLLAVFHGHAHAENLDGYGIKPVAGGNDFAPATAVVRSGGGASANNGFSSAPNNGGFAPAGGAPTSSGYGYTPAPAAVVMTQPPPAYQPPPQPAYQPVAVAAAAAPASDTPYGYKAEPTMPTQRVATAAPYYASSYGSGTGDPGYVLGAGDKIRLTVFDETDLSGDYTVDGSGFVRLPLIGQVRAAGYTTPQLEAGIGSALAQGYLKSPRVAVEVTTYRPFYIIGAVNRPGEYPYVNHMTALSAVALAGGYTPSAVESVIYVRREGSNREVQLPTDRTTEIHPGDVVRVNNTFFWDAMNLFGPLSGPLGIAAAATIH